jgi:hypothetical protein
LKTCQWIEDVGSEFEESEAEIKKRNQNRSDGGWCGWLLTSAFGDESAAGFSLAADPHLVAVAASHGANPATVSTIIHSSTTFVKRKISEYTSRQIRMIDHDLLSSFEG